MSKQAANQQETPAQAARAKPAQRTAADQDAQTQKQAVAQIAFNKAKRETEEADAKASNARTLASNKAKAKPPIPAKLQVGSGAAVGVAKGACDGQPHTQQAVREARAALTKAAQQAVAKGLQTTVDIAGNKLAKVDPALVVNGVQYPNAARAAAARKAAENPKAAPTQPKAKQPKAPTKPRAPKLAPDLLIGAGPNPYNGKPGTWTYYMIAHALAHKTTAQATAARKDQWLAKPLDFKWMQSKGYITLA